MHSTEAMPELPLALESTGAAPHEGARRGAQPTGGERGVPGATGAARAGQSLRAKAFLTFAMVATYVALVGAYLQGERSALLHSVKTLEQAHVREELLGRIGAAVAHASVTVDEARFASEREPDWTALALGAEAVQAGLFAASELDERFAPLAIRLQRLVERVVGERSRYSLIELRETVREVSRALEDTTGRLREQRQRLSEGYRKGFESLTLEAVACALFGLISFGLMMAYFFARMAWDVRRLERRAMRIVDGYRGPPIAVTRRDEIGLLMQSVNQMQAALRAREARLELERQTRMHQEKMAAIGSLAAGIAHEINNPIAAIAGVAEEIVETASARNCAAAGACCRPDLILLHARRVASITRQLSALSAPASPDREPVDVNSLVESVCAFVRYDRRLREVDLLTELDRTVPAVEVVADHVTQVLMNLLMNAADACHSRPGGRRSVVVGTRFDGTSVVIEMVDDGCGMDERTLAQAFDEHFTTKPPGRGTGLGLPLCRRLLDESGGTLELQSIAGEGTTARVRLPVPVSLRPESTGAGRMPTDRPWPEEQIPC